MVNFDLVVTNLTSYTPNRAIRNLYTDGGDFGQINLADDEDCTFRYQFVETNDDTPITIDSPFRFCLFDFDTGEPETVGIPHRVYMRVNEDGDERRYRV